jgi:type IV pilus assembly protein PilW
MVTLPFYPSSSSKHRSKGFSLLELMVGVAIGLVGIVAIFQVLTTWDSRRRSTTAGSDAQISGVIGLFQMEKSLKLAGLGFSTLPRAIFGCPVAAYNAGFVPTNFSFPLVPLSIAQGTDGQTDSITVLSGNSNFVSGGVLFKASTKTTKATAANAGFQLGDLVVVAPQTVVGALNCWLVEINDRSDPTFVSLGHSSASTYVSDYTGTSTTPRYNDPANDSDTLGVGNLYNLGPSPALEVWTIQQPTAGSMRNASKLIKTNLLTNLTTEVMDGVINLQALYGVDGSDATTPDGIISDAEWTATAPADWSRLLAVKVAILTRSQQFEKDYGATVVPSWFAGSTATNFAMFNIDGTAGAAPFTASSNPRSSGDPNDWRSYRYRVYEKVIPLRNVIWPTLQ